MTFTPLRVRSHGSLLAGVASPEALCERAAERGYKALALTDRDNLYLAVRFLRAAAGAGLAALPGAEVTASRSRALLLPFDRRGWSSLCAILTARHLDPKFDLVRSIAELQAGLHVIVESPALAAALVAAGVPPAIAAADEHTKTLRRVSARRAGSGGLWLGVRGLAAERPQLRARLAAAWKLAVPAIATGDVWLLETRDHETHRVAVTAAAGELLERMPAASFCARDAVLGAPAEWERRVRATCAAAGCGDAAELLLANNASLVARSRVQIEMGTPIFPRATLPEGVGGPQQLRRLSQDGFARRYAATGPRRARPSARREARQRLTPSWR